MNKSYAINEIIYRVRKAKGLTQKELAQLLHTTAKTISNWERKKNCVPAEMVSSIVKELKIDRNFFFSEYISPLSPQTSIKFFVCPVCGDISWSFSKNLHKCCDRIIYPMQSSSGNCDHYLYYQSSPDGEQITVSAYHPMDDAHHIRFVAYVTDESAFTIVPPKNAPFSTTFPHLNGGKLYMLCSKHGLFDNEIL